MSISRLGPVAIFAALLAAADAAPLDLHPIPIPAKSLRLLGMSMDEHGFIWLGSTHRLIYRYDPRTPANAEIRLPFDSSTSQCLCVGGKVYLLGQSYPQLIIYERATGSFREAAYPHRCPMSGTAPSRASRGRFSTSRAGGLPLEPFARRRHRQMHCSPSFSPLELSGFSTARNLQGAGRGVGSRPAPFSDQASGVVAGTTSSPNVPPA